MRAVCAVFIGCAHPDVTVEVNAREIAGKFKSSEPEVCRVLLDVQDLCGGVHSTPEEKMRMMKTLARFG